ncbi:MAG TPA: selenocysteine-specific translation elongation factor [Methylibium sp.]|uniref:selenocysteine-specific translation elongation factor n=1 Tax=Methylibium sp. TaxID=2067992 RepID=UPI002DBEBF2E|nr:selenocysteine-specific translation elongation factor [Methylibium sp.]HEU4459855.1 selenocysteine-specific translation elongation factor [Methylibium sp.]
MIIGTAGHIDHGKTSLVKALTGTDTDRLAEEKARGITLDLGFAYASTADGHTLGFVDVPGHEKLVRHMLAGASGIDHVMLVVAADDGPMPQTREHLAILDLLGLSSGVVAITKSDRVSPARLDDVGAELRALLAGSSLAQAPLLPVSARTGAGIEALQAHLRDTAAALPARPATGQFRLAVDRSFSLAGIGTVVTGTAAAGRVAVGDKLVVSPSGKPVRVRGLHAQNREAREGGAGQRLALNLAGVEKTEIARGDWIVAEAIHAPTRRIDARIRLLAGEAQPLAHWTPLHLHLGAVDVSARVVLIESEPVAPGTSAFVQLELQRPIGALHGDRFILRDQSALRTLGGGVVLDAFAGSLRRRRRDRPAALSALSQPTAAEALAALLALEPPEGVALARFATLWNLPPPEAEALARDVPHRSLRSEAEGALAFAPTQIERLSMRLREVLTNHHKRTPDSPGMTAEQLHRAMTAPRPPQPVFAALLRELIGARDLERGGPYLRLAGHEASLQGADRKLWERLAPWLGEGGWNHPPKLSDMLARDRSLHREAVTRLLRKAARLGLVYEVGAEYFILAAHLRELATRAQSLAEADEHRRLNVKTFRETTGISRHLSMPLVEFFDHIGFTKRDPVGRKIRRNATAMFDAG